MLVSIGFLDTVRRAATKSNYAKTKFQAAYWGTKTQQPKRIP